MKRAKNTTMKIGIGIMMILIVVPILYVVLENNMTLEDTLDSLQGESRDFIASRNISQFEFDQEIADLTQEIAQLQALREENQRLRDLMSLTIPAAYSSIHAQVIGSDPLLSNAYVLSKGSSSGVFVGDAVVSGNGHLIGTIIKVTSSRSVVLLTTDEQTRVTVATAGNTKSVGVTQGQFGLSIILDLIPQTYDIQEGDVLVSSGINELLPEGLLVGSVSRIVSSDNDLFKKAILRPLIDLEDIRFVTIMHKL